MIERELIIKKSEANRENLVPPARRTYRSRPVDSPINRILFLQRTIGNQAVQKLINSGALQAKLNISQPTDEYEQETDRVANSIVSMPQYAGETVSTKENQPPTVPCPINKIFRSPDQPPNLQEKRLGAPIPNPKTMEAPERELYDEFVRTCAGVRVLLRLTRMPRISPSEKVRLLEDRLKFIRIYFEQERKDFYNDKNVRKAYECAAECIFGKGYWLNSESDQLASTQCELSKARWQAFALNLHGRIPGERGTDVEGIPEPRACLNPQRLESYLERIKAGKKCENGG